MENRVAIETEPSRGTKAPQPSEADTHGPQNADDLVGAACAGDRAALNRLLAGARPRLLAVALRMVKDRDDAEDVVQEALLKVCRHLTHFEARSAFTTWLHRIVVNAALDRLRRQQPRWERVPPPAEDERHAPAPEAVDEETPERLVARAETGAVVRGAIATLSAPHQEALELRELEGESYQTIAEIARVPVGTVMSRLHHARRKLQAQLATTFEAPSLCAA
jgi:RNA polymerase sigma-70 factor (ECF subfamily)